jgi:hypothetical protein
MAMMQSTIVSTIERFTGLPIPCTIRMQSAVGTQRLRNDSLSTYDFSYAPGGNVTGANGVPPNVVRIS